MKNKNALIGRLKIMRAYDQSGIVREYLDDTIDLLKGSSDYSPEEVVETAAALDELSYKVCRREAEALRDTVEYLEGMKGDTGNEQ